ncbi:MAG: hypothetical protein ACRD47_12005 [Nitrososphaeraceae archaeon]
MQYNAKRDISIIHHMTLLIAIGVFSSVAASGILIIMIETNSLSINPLYFSTKMGTLTNIDNIISYQQFYSISTFQLAKAVTTNNITDRESNIPIGKNITAEDISEFVTVFDDQPFQGGQISPRIAKWVNEDVFLFVQFDKPSPSNATSLNYIGIGKKGIFCEADRPSPDFVHFHKWNATSYREGHGHEAGDEGYWLMWVATNNLDVQGRQVSPGVDRDFSPTPPPKC